MGSNSYPFTGDELCSAAASPGWVYKPTRGNQWHQYKNKPYAHRCKIEEQKCNKRLKEKKQGDISKDQTK